MLDNSASLVVTSLINQPPRGERQDEHPEYDDDNLDMTCRNRESSPDQKQQRRPYLDGERDPPLGIIPNELTPIADPYMLCLSVRGGVKVVGYHVQLATRNPTPIMTV